MVIKFQTLSELRKEFVYKVQKVNFANADEKLVMPCIGLYHKDSGIPVGYPGYEVWLYDLSRVEVKASRTLYKKAISLCNFLNYLLYNTDCDNFQDITLNDIRDWMEAYKTKTDGIRDPDEWSRGCAEVIRFLHNYIAHSEAAYKIKSEDLITAYELKTKNGKQRYVIATTNKMGVKPPRRLKKKYRYILYGYLELLLYVATKYDPMILPGIVLQAYAGLREGEVVNVSYGKVKRVDGGFGIIRKIEIDLKNEAAFAIAYDGKTDFGSIKKYRVQEVYYDFIDTVIKTLDEHELYIRGLGYTTNMDDPLMRNAWGKPMSVSCYTSRVRKLFYNHFLPALNKVSAVQNTLAANAPYIEAYEREYPGAHMFRHWYTMYLLQNTTLSSEEISSWRGDSNYDSMLDYVHVNKQFIDLYRDAVISFQATVLGDIL